jgi:hypothetical protein
MMTASTPLIWLKSLEAENLPELTAAAMSDDAM